MKKKRRLNSVQIDIIHDKQIKRVITEAENNIENGLNNCARFALSKVNVNPNTQYYSYYKKTLAYLEQKELNFNASKKNYLESFNGNPNEEIVFKNLSELEFTMGNFKSSLNYLKNIKNIKINSYYLELGLYHARMKQFDEALHQILKADYEGFTKLELKTYKFLIQYLCCENNVITPALKNLDNVPNYKFAIYQDDENYYGKDHAKKHFSVDVDESNKFYTDINYDQLHDYFMKNKENLIPVYLNSSVIYNIKYPRDIALVDNFSTPYYCVVEIFNTDKVVTMFAFSPSFEYDNEGKTRKKIK